MSSPVYGNENSSPIVARRAQANTEDTGYNQQQRTNSRRSLSDRLRNLFGRNSSSSPNRAGSNDRRTPTTSEIRQGASTPTSGKSSADAPQLHAPTVPKLFGKKKSKLPATSNTPTASKKKIKGNKKTNQAPPPPMQISGPIYQQETPIPIQSQIFHPRTPETVRNTSGRLPQSTSETYEITTTKGYRDYVILDQTQHSQQVVGQHIDEFPAPPTYTSDRSRSPSMNRQRLANTNAEYHYYHDNVTSSGSIPAPDVQVYPGPVYQSRTPNLTPSSTRRIVTEKPPISPPSSTRQPTTIQPSNIGVNPAQSKSTSSSTLSNTGARSTSAEVDVPKLTAPTIPFGSISSKKKAKRTKSQAGPDTKSNSSLSVSGLGPQTSTRSEQSWRKTYGSLPEVEVMQTDNIGRSKPSKSTGNRYPGISAIVQHHILAPPVYYNEHQRPITTTPGGTPGRPQRFETSTTTLDEYGEHSSWPHTTTIGSRPSPSTTRHDGYIRPLTPQQPSIQPDVSIIRVDINDLRGQSPSPRSPRSPRAPRYDYPPEPPKTYRSSATIYTRDKHQYVDGGEIRTWSSHESGIADDYSDSYRKQPYAHVQINYRTVPQTNFYQQQVAPTKSDETYKEYRYSPRAHEQQLYEREHKVVTDQEIEEEEKYEVSYEYEQHHQQQYSYETKSHYDQLHSSNRYSSDLVDDQNVTYANLTSANRTSVVNERDRVYDQSSRSYTSNEHIQEPLSPLSPVNYSKEVPRSYTLKRSDSYDGLGISISASSQTRSNHYIRDVEYGSPGQRAGLRKNDRLISVNGINVENVDFSNVLNLIRQGLDNDNLQLSVIHEPEQN